MDEMNHAPEVLPLKNPERGEIRILADEVSRIRARMIANNLGELNVETYEINPLLEAMSKGYKYLLRLPRVNERGCVAKYGGYYDKLTKYHDFVAALARRNGICEFEFIHNADYAFAKKEDAEKLKFALIEKQWKAELDFEVIDNSGEVNGN